MRKFFLLILATTFISYGQDSQKINDFLLLREMDRTNKVLVDYSLEIARLKESLKGTDLLKSFEGLKAYKDNDFAKGRELFSSINEESPYFSLVTKLWKTALGNSDYKDRKGLNILARNIYETHLRNEIKDLECGCVLGVEHFYSELIKKEPAKLKAFNDWQQKLCDEFDAKKPGNWYQEYGCRGGIYHLEKVNNVIEAVLLGYEKPGEDFRENWVLLNNRRSDFEIKENFSYMGYYRSRVQAFEELRLAILIGNTEVPEYFFRDRWRFIDRLNYEPFKAKALYLRGLYFFLRAENLQMRGDEAARDLLIGKTGAAVQLYLSTRYQPDDETYTKAKKLFDLIGVKSEEWYGRKLKAFPEKPAPKKSK
ncbi:MAG: hypothetical protein NE334_11820 [Lentisphaeraceae bacterium]|nr:hypothetical protein [Lentisphaeraceae bacterium]